MKKNKQIITIQFVLTCDCSFQQIKKKISAVKKNFKKITNSIKLFYNTKTVLSREVLREGLHTFHKASNSVCVQKPALISNEENPHLFGSRSVFEVLQYNH